MAIEKSPFPDEFLGVDLFHGGAWQPLGTDLDQEAVTVAHGARSESGTADVSSLAFRVTNSDGKYSPRNPSSPLYGLVGRNTPARATVSLGAPWLDLETPGARATAPDSADLDIVGDIDIRWWGERDSWRVAADIISKWSATSNQRSWLLRAEADGTLTLFWTTDGSTVLEARSEVALPAWAGRIALRVTMDAANGAAGRTITFEYASELSLAAAPDTASWTPMGDPVIQPGTTSIFSSSAALTLGKEPTSAAGTPPQRVYGWSVRAGITAFQTVRAQGIASDETVGATVFTDADGVVWTVTNGSISNTHVIAACEVAEWPVDWNTKGAESVMTDVQAAGVTRRLGQGEQALDSVLYRAISSTAEANDLLAYWPMEDGSDARSFGPAVGSRAATFGTNVRPAAYDDFPASGPLPTLGTSQVNGRIGKHTSTGEVQMRWVQWTPPAGVAADSVLARLYFTGGTIGRIDVKLNASGFVGVFGYDHDGTELGGSTFVAGTNVENSHRKFSLEVNQNGSNVFWRRSSLEVGETIGDTFGQNFTGSQTLGTVTLASFNRGGNVDDLGEIAVGHLTVGTTITQLFDGVEGAVLTGYTGEQSADRLVRLVTENGSTAISVRGNWSTPMGEQQEEKLSDLMAEAAAADGGMLHDDSRSIGLRYRTLRAMGSQPAVTIAYDDNLIIPFKPTDDDALTRNRVTVQRPNGTRFTEEVTQGPMSTQPPEDGGVGVYDESVTRNLHDDDLVRRTAGWRVHVGTWDEGRYPTLGVDLADPRLLNDPLLIRLLLSLRVGDRLVITDPPPWLPPFAVDVLVMGIQIEVTPMHLRLRWNCRPARPYRVAYWNAGHRWSGTGTVLTNARTTTDTALNITCPTGTAWTDEDGPYDIVIGGEAMTVTDVNTDSTTMTVTRSVNGVVKAHPAGAAVELADPSFYAR